MRLKPMVWIVLFRQLRQTVIELEIVSFSSSRKYPGWEFLPDCFKQSGNPHSHLHEQEFKSNIIVKNIEIKSTRDGS